MSTCRYWMRRCMYCTAMIHPVTLFITVLRSGQIACHWYLLLITTWWDCDFSSGQHVHVHPRNINMSLSAHVSTSCLHRGCLDVGNMNYLVCCCSVVLELMSLSCRQSVRVRTCRRWLQPSKETAAPDPDCVTSAGTRSTAWGWPPSQPKVLTHNTSLFNRVSDPLINRCSATCPVRGPVGWVCFNDYTRRAKEHLWCCEGPWISHDLEV